MLPGEEGLVLGLRLGLPWWEWWPLVWAGCWLMLSLGPENKVWRGENRRELVL